MARKTITFNFKLLAQNNLVANKFNTTINVVSLHLVIWHLSTI